MTLVPWVVRVGMHVCVTPLVWCTYTSVSLSRFPTWYSMSEKDRIPPKYGVLCVKFTLSLNSWTFQWFLKLKDFQDRANHDWLLQVQRKAVVSSVSPLSEWGSLAPLKEHPKHLWMRLVEKVGETDGVTGMLHCTSLWTSGLLNCTSLSHCEKKLVTRLFSVFISVCNEMKSHSWWWQFGMISFLQVFFFLQFWNVTLSFGDTCWRTGTEQSGPADTPVVWILNIPTPHRQYC